MSPGNGLAREWHIAVALIAATIASLSTALLAGTYPISARELVDSVLFPVPGVVHDVIWQLRAPRAMAAFACGGLLALAGLLLQVLLRNPLADPYVLGVSGGAALGALLALTFGAGTALMSTASLGGALAAILIVFIVGFRGRDWNVYRLLLTGIVLSAGFAALASLTLALAPQAQVKGMLFWLMGDLAYAGSSLPAWAILAVGAALVVTQAVRLDLLALDEIKAQSLGVAVRPLQAAVFLVAAFATVAAVQLAGAIGFVGLMVPHAVRLMGVTRHRALAPLAILLGGSFLTVADVAARTVWAPLQLPVGVLTALFGVPAMLWLLGRMR
ncbi:MAG: iron ABC transporter permease [Betaproteobacteria bacterium]|nr:iron ABC transporter permease [Betaproteobacteria bacterium]